MSNRLGYLVTMTERLAEQTVLRLEAMDCSWFPVYGLHDFAQHRAFITYGRDLAHLSYYSRN